MDLNCWKIKTGYAKGFTDSSLTKLNIVLNWK